jgi:cyd operon protein YbgT
MWYFSWILGVMLALSLGIINALWYESEFGAGVLDEDDQDDRKDN